MSNGERSPELFTRLEIEIVSVQTEGNLITRYVKINFPSLFSGETFLPHPRSD